MHKVFLTALFIEPSNFDLLGVKFQFLFALRAKAVVALDYFQRRFEFESVIENRATLGAENLLGHNMTTLIERMQEHGNVF